jgi:hypothetical protein
MEPSGATASDDRWAKPLAASPTRVIVLTAVTLHHAHSTFDDFGGKFSCLSHGSSFSSVGASEKAAAIHPIV